MQYAGWGFTGLSIVFLLMDSGMKLAQARASVDATVALGFGAEQVRVLGAILFIATLLYALPRTAPLGAILITAYLGGAVAIHMQHRSPLASHTLFGVYMGLLVWGGLYLRSAGLRALIPIAQAAPLAGGGLAN